jgi:1-acyl-sn-glycerol-3-phosphate acyltransferase
MAYRVIKRAVTVFLKIIFGLRITGAENVGAGPMLVTANHAKATDPIYAVCAFPLSQRLRIMGKAELFRFVPLGKLITAFGAYPIDRGAGDMGALKKTLEMLKSGENVIIFPDGHRSNEENPENAKTGAAMIAVKANVPVLPMYITPDRRFLRKRVRVNIGKPFFVKLPEGTPRGEGYRAIARDMMDRIYALGK